MKIFSLQQGTPEWHAYRRSHFNASDAAAMLGISPYKTRDELLAEYATGIEPEYDEATLARFEEGHRLEEKARAKAEELIGEDLFAVVGEWDDAEKESLPLSASFDGITLDGCAIWEHKTLNNDLRETKVVPDHYQAQIQQQLLISGAPVAHFHATDGDGNEQHIPIAPDAAWQKRLIAGWRQFKKDLAGWQQETLAPEVIGQTPETLPVLSIRAEGRIISSNLSAYIAGARAIVAGIKTTLTTDNDFADAEKTVKWAKTSEEAINTAKAALISQTADIGTALTQLDALKDELRDVRLKLDRAVKQEKEARKKEMVDRALDAFRAHLQRLQVEISTVRPGIVFSVPQPSFGEAIKGLRTISSIQNALDTALAQGKIDADAKAQDWREKLAWLKQQDGALEHLWRHDLGGLLEKPLEDFQPTIKTRVAEEKEAQAKRQEAERARIRAEEEARARADAAQKQEAERARIRAEEEARVRADAAPISDIANSNVIRDFLNHRNFGKDESRIRAVLMEFVKFCQQRQTTAAN